jgi:hypothetical protein
MLAPGVGITGIGGIAGNRVARSQLAENELGLTSRPSKSYEISCFLIARGQARAIIWRDGTLPADVRSVDMAVVVSQSQNEIDDLKQRGLEILPHRARMQKEDLESKFRSSDDPLRLVFVCAMWITGFDVPTM